MEGIYIVIVFLFGTIFGSFYNVVGFRLPKNLSLVYPGSFCPNCNHALKWYELIPLFSFFIQGGKCRKCKQKISWFYPIIEFLTGVLFVVSYLFFGFSKEFVFSLITVSFLVIVIVSDFNYLMIPDEVTFVATILLLLAKLVTSGWKVAGYALLSGAFAFIFMYLVMILGDKLFRKESLGGGDIKLMFFVGVLLSPLNVLLCLFIASALALPISLIHYFIKKENLIAFGPFLLLGALLIFWFQLDLFTILGI